LGGQLRLDPLRGPGADAARFDRAAQTVAGQVQLAPPAAIRAICSWWAGRLPCGGASGAEGSSPEQDRRLKRILSA
jgi:hypothetical protein